MYLMALYPSPIPTRLPHPMTHYTTPPHADVFLQTSTCLGCFLFLFNALWVLPGFNPLIGKIVCPFFMPNTPSSPPYVFLHTKAPSMFNCLRGGSLIIGVTVHPGVDSCGPWPEAPPPPIFLSILQVEPIVLPCRVFP